MEKVILVLLFVVSVFASDDEIGKPVVDWKKGFIESAVLASDGKSFYTLQGKDLIHWSLSPLKKLEAWEIPLKKITTGKKQNRFHDIWFLDNYTKVLITSIEGMMIYNLKIYEIEKEISYNIYSLVKDGDFIYLTHPTHIKGNKNIGYERYNIDFEKWSAAELKKIQSINITNMREKYIGICYIDEDGTESSACPIDTLGSFALGRKNIYYPTIYDSAIVLDKSTLKYKGTIEKYSNIFEILEGGYLNTGSAIYRLSDDKHIKYKGRGWGFKRDHNLEVIQDLRTRAKRYTKVDNLDLGTRKLRYPYMFGKYNHSKIKHYILSQYNKNIVIWAKNSRNPIFESSSKHMQLLQMKTKDGKIIPMNDATYNKYYTKSILGVN